MNSLNGTTKKIIKIFVTLIVIMLISTLLFACETTGKNPSDSDPTPIDPKPTPDEPIPELKKGNVQITAIADGVGKYEGAEVYVEDVKLDLYNVKVNNEHRWNANPQNRSDSGVGYFSLDGKTTITVKSKDMTECVVRPLSAGVEVKCENGQAKFVLKSAGNYSIEPDGDPKKAFFLFVSDIEESSDESGNVMRFEKGIHTSANDSRIKNDTVYLSSNMTVVFEEGAVVRARFVANGSKNITLKGKGIIDGSTFERNANTGAVTVPLDFNYCSNLKLEDFSVLDPAGWCVNWYFCTDSVIDGVKIITSRSNGDGISLQSCKNIEVKNCFLRTWDDSLVVKNYPNFSNKNIEGETRNISFSDCTVWTDLAQSMEIGYETIGEVMEDISFTNITVLHNFHKPVMSIHNGNNAVIKNVTYDTITVEDASMGHGDAGSNNQLFEFATEYSSIWSTNHKTTALGKVDGVTVKNVSVVDGNIIMNIRVAGSVDSRSGYENTVHRVDNVTFENIWIHGKVMNSNYSYIKVNQYASVSVSGSSEEKRARFLFSKTDEELSDYSDNATVTVY